MSISYMQKIIFGVLSTYLSVKVTIQRVAHTQFALQISIPIPSCTGTVVPHSRCVLDLDCIYTAYLELLLPKYVCGSELEDHYYLLQLDATCTCRAMWGLCTPGTCSSDHSAHILFSIFVPSLTCGSCL